MMDMDRAAVEEWRRRECAADVSDWSDAASLLIQMLTNAVEGRPSIEEIGLRAWIMCSRVAPGCLGVVAAALRREMQRVAAVCNGHLTLRVPRDSSQVVMVVERVLGAETRTPERTGRRVSLLAYALCRGAAVVNALPSLEEIGRLWRLRARNKRSLPSLEMKRLLREHWLAGRPMWFQKSAAAVESYAAAQAGNDNRAGDCPERRALAHYTAEVRDGIPVRPEFRTLSPRALAKRLSQMAEDADRRRLGI